MVIYEVNLTISNEIFNDFYNWLIKHIELMLQFQGFRKATISKEKLDEANVKTTKLTVHYILDSEQDLDNYLKTHAPAMREEGRKIFGDKFSAFRRILLQTALLESHSQFNTAPVC